MGLALQLGRRQRLIVGLSRLPNAAPDWWLVGLRWIALAGMGLTAWVGQRLVPSLANVPLELAIAAVGIVNLGWMLLLRFGRTPIGATLGAQLVLDLVMLTTILWLSGGLTNPFASFLVFQVLLTGLVGTRGVAILVTGLALAAVPLLGLAHPLDFAASPIGAERVATLGRVLSLFGVGLFSGAFVILYTRRLAVLREAGERSARLAGLGRVIASMCHELNTPLGSIVLAGTDLAQLGKTLDGADVEELGRTVVTEAQRASDVIGLMRGYLSADARTEEVALAELVRETAEAECKRQRFAGALTFEMRAQPKLTVHASALRQILRNLVANAIDATTTTGRKRPAQIAITVGARGQSNELEIAVADNGEGVDASALDHLGEPFHTTKADRGGSGLGLYVSTLLAERLGASLLFETRAERGTTVTLVLPA